MEYDALTLLIYYILFFAAAAAAISLTYALIALIINIALPKRDNTKLKIRCKRYIKYVERVTADEPADTIKIANEYAADRGSMFDALLAGMASIDKQRGVTK